MLEGSGNNPILEIPSIVSVTLQQRKFFNPILAPPIILIIFHPIDNLRTASTSTKLILSSIHSPVPVPVPLILSHPIHSTFHL